MDPDATLARALHIAEEAVALRRCSDRDGLALAVALRELNEWFTQGGFLPAPWAAVHRNCS